MKSNVNSGNILFVMNTKSLIKIVPMVIRIGSYSLSCTKGGVAVPRDERSEWGDGGFSANAIVNWHDYRSVKAAFRVAD
ncbi:hypothetical protein GCM10011418_09790 [Sphingobacterium alkalisoli]|nr:hypothetical protein GCM10011418_09790 [Sphingobacterium alkalisoli]